jgi:CRP/FNR family cyclic AMP-dependent transcriptional regulator
MTIVDPVGGVDELLAAIAAGGDVLEAADEAMSSSPDRAREPVQRLAAASSARALDSRRLADSIEFDGDDRLELFRDSLVTASRRDAVTAIRAVALLRDTGAIAVALENLSEADAVQRANALEVIETIGDRELVRPLLALWETGRSHRLEEDWRERALHHPDDWIRACAEWAAEARNENTDDTKDAEERVDDGGDTMTETLATLPVMERVLFLRRVPLFADLPPQDLLPIAAIASEQSFADADTIAEQDEPGDEMHIIVSGYVMVILRQQDGHQQVLAVRSAGDVIGEMAVITSRPRMASLAAKGPVRLLSIGRRQFEAMLRERPETSLALMRVLCQRLADRDAAAPE